MITVLEARGLACGYGQETVVVPALDLEVRSGEVVVLLGSNGAGKTTTIMTLAGELTPLGGTLLCNGEPTTEPLYRRARDGLGLVTEERAVLMTMSVFDNLRVARCDQNIAFELFPELKSHLRRPVGLLSGGQQQMLALAMALARPITVLLADELSLGLAPLVVERLLQVLREAADRGVGVLLVEQHIHKALTIADRAYVMQRGQIRFSGSVRDLTGQLDELQAAYLSGPVGTNPAPS